MSAFIEKILEDKKSLQRVGAVLASLFLIFGGIYLLESTGPSISDLPSEFLETYLKAAEISNKLVELTGSVNEKIKSINELDRNGGVGEAQRLIEEAQIDNNKAKEKALELSDYLTTLATIINDIDSVAGQRVAIEAVVIESTLIQELINYTNELDRFLETLNIAISTNSFDDRLSVQNRVDEVNQQAATINSLNKRFLNKVKELGIE